MSVHKVLEASHIIAVFAWMLGMMLVPRLFVYHSQTNVGSELDNVFKRMEERSFSIILHPAMCIAIILGVILAIKFQYYHATWLHIKFVFIVIMIILHFRLMKYKNDFKDGRNVKTSRFFVFLNEGIFVNFCIIVCLAVIKHL